MLDKIRMNGDGTQYGSHIELCMRSQHCTQVCYVRWKGDKCLNGLLINIKIKDLTLFSFSLPEFELYILEHPEIEEQIPDNAMIVLVPEYDQELAEANKEPGQTIVYIRITRLRTSRIEGLTLQVA